MATTASTPLWLDLKKEYIDDNFEKLLSYLKNKQDSRTNDSFYHKTIDLLKERITELIQQIASRPIYGENPELEQVKFNARLLASYLLIENEGGLAFSAYVAFIRELMILSPKFADRLIQTAIERLKHEKIINLSFYWHDIMDFKPEAFIYKITKNSRFANIIKKPLVITERPCCRKRDFTSLARRKMRLRNCLRQVPDPLTRRLVLPSERQATRNASNHPRQISRSWMII